MDVATRGAWLEPEGRPLDGVGRIELLPRKGNVPVMVRIQTLSSNRENCTLMYVLAGLVLFSAAASTFIESLPMAIVLFSTIVAGATIEVGRRLAGRERWWIAYLSFGPWLVLVPVPWTFFAVYGDWRVVGLRIDTDLPHTWGVHLVALVGFTLGTLGALAVPTPRRNRKGDQRPIGRLRVNRLNGIMALLVAIYMVSFAIADRPLSALWKLSGSVVYGADVDAGTGLLVLDLSLVAASVTLLIFSCGRRSLCARPVPAEVGWLALCIVLALGSGVRGRLFLLVIGWGLVQFIPGIEAARRSRTSRSVAVLAGIIGLVLALQATAIIADERVRVSQRGETVARRAVESTEVIGSAEALLRTNVQLGVLGGQSYMELPKLLVPAKVTGGEKKGPAGDELLRHHLSADAGYSAPLWFEAALNYEGVGVFIFSLVFAFGGATILRRLRRRTSDFALAALALGPVWSLVSYTALKRLTLFQALVTTAASIIGIWLGSKTIHRGGGRRVSSALRGVTAVL